MLTPTQRAWRGRIEAVLRLAAPGARPLPRRRRPARRAVERDDLDWVPPRTALAPDRDAAPVSSQTVEETLAWEAEQRPRAATIAVARRPAARSPATSCSRSLTQRRADRGRRLHQRHRGAVGAARRRRARGREPARAPGRLLGDNAALLCARARSSPRSRSSASRLRAALPLPRDQARAPETVGRAAVLRGARRARALPARPPLREIAQWIGAAASRTTPTAPPSDGARRAPRRRPSPPAAHRAPRHVRARPSAFVLVA